MHGLYVFSVWLHIVAVTCWLGGMLFLALVVVPWMRQGNRAQGAAILSATGLRFRFVGWVCFGLLLVTGSFQLYMRGVRWSLLLEPAWWSSSLGVQVANKLGTFVLVVLVSAVHDFYVGPEATRVLMAETQSPKAEKLRRAASWMGRFNTVLAMLLVYWGVRLVRG